MVKNCSQLCDLDISYCRHITQDALMAGARAAAHRWKLFSLYYTQINASYIPSMNDEVLAQLAPRCESLRSLQVA